MAVLKIKDKNGNILTVPAIQGEDGNLIFSQEDQVEIEDKTLDLMQQAEEMLL